MPLVLLLLLLVPVLLLMGWRRHRRAEIAAEPANDRPPPPRLQTHPAATARSDDASGSTWLPSSPPIRRGPTRSVPAARLREINARLAVLRAELDAADADLKAHQDSLRRSPMRQRQRDLAEWHEKSRDSWFGNGGKALPRSALFGQDLTQRAQLKAEKQVLEGATRATHREIARLRQQVIAPRKAERMALVAERDALQGYKTGQNGHRQ